MWLICMTEVNKCSQLQGVATSQIKQKYNDLKKGHFHNEVWKGTQYNVYKFSRNCYVTFKYFCWQQVQDEKLFSVTIDNFISLFWNIERNQWNYNECEIILKK